MFEIGDIIYILKWYGRTTTADLVFELIISVSLHRLGSVEVARVSFLLWRILDYPSASTHTSRCAAKGGFVPTPERERAAEWEERWRERFWAGSGRSESQRGCGSDTGFTGNASDTGKHASSLGNSFDSGKWVWFAAAKPSTEGNMAASFETDVKETTWFVLVLVCWRAIFVSVKEVRIKNVQGNEKLCQVNWKWWWRNFLGAEVPAVLLLGFRVASGIEMDMVGL